MAAAPGWHARTAAKDLVTGFIAAVTPSNSTDIKGTDGVTNTEVEVVPNFLRIGGAGNIYVDVAGNGNRGATATGTYSISGALGDIVATIGGTGVTLTGASYATDAEAATDLAALINANSTVNKLVSAAADGTTITLTPVAAGKFGNAITTTATGTGLTADQATLAGGTGGSGNYVKYQVVAGQRLELPVTRVYALGTTATFIVAEW